MAHHRRSKLVAEMQTYYRHAVEHGTPLAERPLLPARTQGMWLTLMQVWRWPVPGTRVLTADLATAACGVEFLRELPPERGRRLDHMLAWLHRDAAPEPARLADWTEAMLGAMLRDRRPIADWNAAYSDIARLFEKSPGTLRSRRILLTDTWELKPCASGPLRRGAQCRSLE